MDQNYFILSNILSLTLDNIKSFQIRCQKHRMMTDVDFFCSHISFHPDHNGSKLTQMLLLIKPILYSQSVISLRGAVKLQMISGYIKAPST